MANGRRRMNGEKEKQRKVMNLLKKVKTLPQKKYFPIAIC
jgi:hypothetical protein